MTTRGPHVSLVVPVHHCEGSLDALLGELDRFLAKAPTATELLLVDDRGSAPNASAELCRFANRPHVRVLQNDRNRGKGYSVARGMLEATGLFRVFNKMVRMTLIPGVLDTQAGLKGYTLRAARAVFPRVRIAGFGFDLESLFVARRLGLRIEQVPVRFRYNDEPTTVRFVRDARTMATDLARIRWRGWTGKYEVPAHAALRADQTPDDDNSETSREREATLS